MAVQQTLAGFLGDDIKHVLSVIGLNLTDIDVTFEIAAGPEQAAGVNAVCTLLGVTTDEDGITTSIIQVFAAAADVRSAVDALGGLSGDPSMTLFYQLRFASLPGEAGTAAITTILYGDYVMKGEVNG